MTCHPAAAVFTDLAKAPAKRVEWLCTQQRSTACALALSAHATSYAANSLVTGHIYGYGET